jgi:hypothetical protein
VDAGSENVSSGQPELEPIQRHLVTTPALKKYTTQLCNSMARF